MKTSNFETAFITHDDNDGDTNQALCVAQDSQGDVYLWTEGATATQSLRYREPVLGGGLFPNTREALIQLIEAIKKDENQKEKSINQNIISGLNSIYKFTKEVEKLLEEEKTQNKNFYGKFYFMLKDCFDSNIYNFYNVKKEAKDVIIDSKLYRNKTFYTTEEYNSKYTFIW